MKRVAPAAERNKLPILEVLREMLPPSGMVLEIASGSGQHVVFFARALPNLTWQPSDVDAEALASITAYRHEAGLPNLRRPILLNVADANWPAADAVVCINMIHIAPWAACLGLLRGAAHVLPAGGPLVLYGPFSIDGDFTASSNADFDQSLRQTNPEWGVRELREVERAAEDTGLVLDGVVPRPANNHMIVFRRTQTH
jgi:cyclopropane fatty-acyl-phospholipid synthase-like methyltransferase